MPNSIKPHRKFVNDEKETPSSPAPDRNGTEFNDRLGQRVDKRNTPREYTENHIFKHVSKGSLQKYVVCWYVYTSQVDTIEPPEHIPLSCSCLSTAIRKVKTRKMGNNATTRKWYNEIIYYTVSIKNRFPPFACCKNDSLSDPKTYRRKSSRRSANITHILQKTWDSSAPNELISPPTLRWLTSKVCLAWSQFVWM